MGNILDAIAEVIRRSDNPHRSVTPPYYPETHLAAAEPADAVEPGDGAAPGEAPLQTASVKP